MPDLFGTGVFQPLVPIVPEAKREEMAQQRPQLLKLFGRQIPPGHHLLQGDDETLSPAWLLILWPPGKVGVKDIDEGPVAGALVHFEAATF